MLVNLLYQFDSAGLLWINHWPHPALLNSVAIFLHYATRGMIVYFLLYAVLLLYRKYHETVYILLCMLAVAGMADLILKPFFHRVRPFVEIPSLITLHPLPTTYSFPSAQTAVAFTIAMACTLVFKNNWKYSLWIWAILIGVDRMYMGHHYPTDVLAGAVIGILIALIILFILKQTRWSINSSTSLDSASR